MAQQQSFYPLLSNATIYERMFRYKPYTKCIECLSNDKLKCRKCMQVLIKEVSINENQGKNLRLKQRSPSKHLNSSKYTQYKKQEPALKKSYSVKKTGKQNQNKLIITSKYNFWMAQRIKRKEQHRDYKALWPRKTRFNNSQFDIFDNKQPKFEKWEKKLVDQLLSRTQSSQ